MWPVGYMMAELKEVHGQQEGDVEIRRPATDVDPQVQRRKRRRDGQTHQAVEGRGRAGYGDHHLLAGGVWGLQSRVVDPFMTRLEEICWSGATRSTPSIR